MTSRYFYALWLTLALVCGSVLAQDGIRWAPDIAQARRASAQFKVPLLIHFYGDNCLPCQTLEQRVLSQKEVIDDLNRYFICVKVNATQDRKTAAEFQVHSWPTDVFVSPDGKTLYQGVCQQDVRGYIGILENVAVMNRDRNIMLAAASAPTAPTDIAQQTAPVGTGSMTAPQLPPPGTNLMTSSQTQSFYTAPQTSQFQQLEASTSPGRGVQSGPLLAGGQPASITGSTPGANQQIAAPEATQLNTNANGHLPPRAAMTAQLASPMDKRGVPARMVGYPQVTVEAATPNVPVAVSAKQSEFNNPYYPQPAMPAPATASNAATAPSNSLTVPTSTMPAANMPAANTPSLQVAVDVAAPSAPTSSNNPLMPAGTFQPREATASEKQAPTTSTLAVNAPAMNPTATSNLAVSSPAMNFPSSIEPAAPTDTTATEVATAETTPGVGGYCPVTLRTTGQWVEGSPEFVVKHRGKVYWMCSEQAMQQFLQAPDASSPVLSGYDPMIFLSQGKLVEGDIRFGLHEEVGGSILLFESDASKRAYERDYDKNTRALNVILQSAGAK